MEKIRAIMSKIFTIIVAFLGYSIIQGLYILPDMKDTRLFVVLGALAITLSIIGIIAMWSGYTSQLKKYNPRNFDQKPHFNWPNVGKAVLGVIAMLVLQISFSMLMGPAQPDNQVALNQIGASGSPLFYLMVAVVAPIIEEIIFRGYLVNLVLVKDTKLNRLISILIGGLVFGLLHEPHFSLFFVVYGGMGVILTAVYIYTKDLRYSIVVHIVNNVLSIL